MKKTILLLSFLAVLCLGLAGCVTEFYVRVPSPAVIVEEDARLYYDDPVRGWYVEGYYGPTGIWIAPFWTTDVLILHRHFGYYRGYHRNHMENHFGRHPERFRGGHQGPRHQPQGPGHQIRQPQGPGHQPNHQAPKQTPPRKAPPKPARPRR